MGKNENDKEKEGEFNGLGDKALWDRQRKMLLKQDNTLKELL